MADKKISRPFKTKTGIAVHPHLLKADFKYNKKGEFKTKLRLGAADAERLVKLVDEAIDEAGYPKDDIILPYTEDEDTGDFIFVIKSQRQPAFSDVKGLPVKLPDDEDEWPKIWTGAKIRVKGSFAPWTMISEETIVENGKKRKEQTTKYGVKAYLNGFQLVKLGAGGDFDDASDELDDDEEGYTPKAGAKATKGSYEEPEVDAVSGDEGDF